MVPAGSDRISRVRPYSGTGIGRKLHFAYGALTLCGAASQLLRLYNPFVTPRAVCSRLTASPTTPMTKRLHAITRHRFGLDPRSLAATKGVEVSFLSSGYLDVSVRLLTFLTLCVQIRMTGHYPSRVSPFGNPRVKGCSAPHRGLSQPSTSFIGS